MSTTTLERITKILVDYRDFDPASIKAETTFVEIGLDSLDTVDLVMKLEEEFGFDIPMSENIKSVGDLVTFIDAKA